MKSQIRFLDPKLKQSFDRLKAGDDSERELHQSLNHAFDEIESDFTCGTQIQKRLIPKEYGAIENLWKYDLPKGWRLLYTVAGSQIVVVSIILEWLDHKNYERRFKY